MLKIYGVPLSSPFNKVRFVAGFLGLDYEVVKINLATGEHMKEEFLRINPIGKVPAIQDGDFTLSESNAIIKYLTQKAKSDLYPEDLQVRAQVDQWLDFSSMHIHSAMVKVIFNRLFAKHMTGFEPDERSIEEGLKFLARFLPVVDKQLSTNKFLSGDKMTLADMSLLATLDPAEAGEIDLSVYPALSKWRNELKTQDFYTKCHKNYEENLMALAK